MFTPEERKAHAAKGHATAKANRERKKLEEELCKKHARELKFGILELREELEMLRQSVQMEEKFIEAAKELKTGLLLREHEIVEHAMPAVSACGIYFLIDEKKVVYVGQSVNVFSRVFAHLGSKNFDSYVYLPCEKEKLDKLESLYIHFLSPPLNGNTPAGNKLAPLTLDSLLK